MAIPLIICRYKNYIQLIAVFICHKFFALHDNATHAVNKSVCFVRLNFFLQSYSINLKENVIKVIERGGIYKYHFN